MSAEYTTAGWARALAITLTAAAGRGWPCHTHRVQHEGRHRAFVMTGAGLGVLICGSRRSAALRRDTDLPQVDLEADRVHRLSGLAAAEEPL